MKSPEKILVEITNIRLDTWYLTDLVIVAMKEYAKEYHKNEVKKMNKAKKLKHGI